VPDRDATVKNSLHSNKNLVAFQDGDYRIGVAVTFLVCRADVAAWTRDYGPIAVYGVFFDAITEYIGVKSSESQIRHIVLIFFDYIHSDQFLRSQS